MAPHIPSRPLTSPHIRPSTSARTTRAPLYTCLLAHALAHAPHAPPHPSPLAPHPGPLNLHPSPFVLRPSFLTLTSPNHAWAQLSSHPLIPHLTPQLSPSPLAPQPAPLNPHPQPPPLAYHPSPCIPHPAPLTPHLPLSRPKAQLKPTVMTETAPHPDAVAALARLRFC